MTRLLRALLFLLPAAAVADTAFVNVHVIPMDRPGVLEAQTVVVRDGRIASLGPVATTAVPEDVTVVDGTDRYLMPGLAEMHAHVPAASSKNLDRVLTLFVANGVTSIRGMLGQPSHLALREELEAGTRFGPRLYTSGPSFNGNSVRSPQQAADMVEAQRAAGYDFLKIHPGLTRAEFVAMAEAANAADIRFAGHVPADVGLDGALGLGISTIDHLDGYMEAMVPPNEDPSGGFGGFFGLLLAGVADESRIESLAARTQAAGTWNVPTQALFEHRVGPDAPAVMADWPEMKYIAAEDVAQWVSNKEQLLRNPEFDPAVAARAIELRRKLILALHRAGAGLLLGSDAPQVFNVPGFAAHRELAYLVAAGLTPAEALATGTVNAARWLEREDELGSITPGKLADLVLLDDNPLADIGNSRRVHGVMLRGQWYSRAELDRRLALFAR